MSIEAHVPRGTSILNYWPLKTTKTTSFSKRSNWFLVVCYLILIDLTSLVPARFSWYLLFAFYICSTWNKNRIPFSRYFSDLSAQFQAQNNQPQPLAKTWLYSWELPLNPFGHHAPLNVGRLLWTPAPLLPDDESTHRPNRATTPPVGLFVVSVNLTGCLFWYCKDRLKLLQKYYKNVKILLKFC